MQDNCSDDATGFIRKNATQADKEFAKYEEILSVFHNCSLCGTPLEFLYTVELPGSLIREEARCVHCEIKIRNKLFNIQ